MMKGLRYTNNTDKGKINKKISCKHGLHLTFIIRDKKKYSRKVKHKGDYHEIQKKASIT